LLKPKGDQTARGPLRQFFAWFNRGFLRITNGYVRTCGMLIRKLSFAILLLLGFVVLAGGLGRIVPSSFLPDEDQGYFIMNVQLPEAASLQRTAATIRQIDEILRHEPGVRYFSGIAG